MTSRGAKRISRWAAALVLALSALLAPLAGAAPPGQTTQLNLAPGTRALNIAAGPGGNLWFTGQNYFSGSDLVGRVSPGGAVAEYALPFRPVPGLGDIAAGVDGNLWFTDPGANAIGRVDSGGQITEFGLPTPAAVPTAIVAGPGGLWFTEEGADKVGLIGYNGAIAEFPLKPGARPSGLAVGPDGALWIAEKGRAAITRLAPGGALTEHLLPDPGSLPHAIVVGPGEALWFSDESAPRIGRITTAGVVDDFRVPVKVGTRELVLGDDGRLWYTAGHAIGSLIGNGKTGQAACVDSRCRLPVTALAAGPGERLWFATGARIVADPSKQLAQLARPGTVGTFLAPPLRVRLGARAGRAGPGLATVGVSCGGGAAGQSCDGVLRLTAVLSRSRAANLFRHRYRVQPASGRRLPLRLGARGKRLLERRGRLVVRVRATLAGGPTVNRRYVLRARARAGG